MMMKSGRAANIDTDMRIIDQLLEGKGCRWCFFSSFSFRFFYLFFVLNLGLGVSYIVMS